jgi:hypothetical protein
MLGTDHHRPAANLDLMQVGELLQLPGGEDSAGPGSGDEPSRARALTAPGSENHRPRLPVLEPGRRGADHMRRRSASNLQHRGLRVDLDRCLIGPAQESGGIPGPVHGAAELLEPETGMVAVAGNPTGSRFPFQHHHPCDTEPAESGSGGKPCGTGPDHKRIDTVLSHRPATVPSSSAGPFPDLAASHVVTWARQ